MLQATHPMTATTSSFTGTILDQVRYNCWANTTLVNFLRTKSPELLEKNVASSYPSIKATLLHMWDCQDWWMANMRNEQPGFSWTEGYNGTLDDILTGIVENSNALVNYVENLAPSQLTDTCLVAIPFTGDFLIPRSEMMQQVVMHSTYHRGQAVTIGRQLGFTDAPNTDLMWYLLLIKNK
ncbi:DinB family protein [Chitinophaga sp. sic0106]|uniref:DinB family protein n=1 Tax=Chitinophaga sp. sic0106 TaxID=2854785 RepID=UPI001C460920|nr:DinB family protein [Chitinophaga sp. sic0106]MBV7531575.1 DinB family protein [Chitinophaga sp. sic0106]